MTGILRIFLSLIAISSVGTIAFAEPLSPMTQRHHRVKNEMHERSDQISLSNVLTAVARDTAVATTERRAKQKFRQDTQKTQKLDAFKTTQIQIIRGTDTNITLSENAREKNGTVAEVAYAIQLSATSEDRQWSFSCRFRTVYRRQSCGA